MRAQPRPEAPLIRTKLRAPNLPGNFVSRQRIVDLVERGSRQTVLLLSAPAGFGKSTAVLDWLSSRPSPASVAWLSLDIHDNAPSRFWGHVLAGLGEIIDAVGSESAEWLGETAEGDPLLFMGGFINELTRAESDTWLVLDDIHLVENPELLAQLDYIIHHLPPTMRVILTSRFDPGLALHRLRAGGGVFDIRADDLRMDRDEIASFLGRQIERFEDTTVRDLERRTDGWPAAVQLLTLRMAQSEDAAAYLATSVGDVRPIVDYMVAEILDNLPAELRTFVLEVSVLDGFTAELCDALLDATDSQWRIQDILDRHLFVTESVSDDRWFRLHQLFVDIVRSELRYRDRCRWMELHRRAAGMMREQGELEQALDHACLGEDWDFVVGNAMDAVLQFANQGDVDSFRRWLGALPDDYVDRDATTTVLIGLTHAFARDFSEADRLFEKAAADENDNELRPSLMARACLALVAGNRDSVSAWHDRAQRALAAIPAGDTAEGAFRAEAMAAAQLAAACCYGGELDEARIAGERALSATGVVEFPAPRALANGALGLTAVFAGELPEARRAVARMSSIIDGTDLEVMAHGPMRDELVGRLAFESDDLDGALDHLDRAWGSPRVRPSARPGVAATLSRAFAARRDDAASRIWLDRGQAAQEAVVPHPAGELELLLAELAIAEAGMDLPGFHDLARRLAGLVPGLSGDPAIIAAVGARRADHLVGVDRQWPTLDPTSAGPRAMVDYHLLSARNATDDACRRGALLSALDVVGATGLVRAVRAWGDETITAISRLAGDHQVAAWILRGAEKPDDATAVNDLLPVPLSASELRVLTELTSGDPYHEIAERLYVSTNTVKSHIKAIYRKLDVHSRVAAVERARELGFFALE